MTQFRDQQSLNRITQSTSEIESELDSKLTAGHKMQRRPLHLHFYGARGVRGIIFLNMTFETTNW